MKNWELIESVQIEVYKHLKLEWLSSQSTEWYDYIVSLPERFQITYLVVIYHNQVFNGGHDQWFINHYGQFASETIRSLKLIGADRKADLLKEAFTLVNHKNDPDKIFRSKVLANHPELMRALDFVSLRLNEIDSAYYATENDEDIQTLLGSYLAKVTN